MGTFDQPEWAHQRLIWRICLTPIHALAILTSIYRICRRYKTRQLGLDDHAATLALILDLIFFPTLWLRNGDSGPMPGAGMSAAITAGSGDDGLNAKIGARIVQVVIGWITQIVYPLLTWTTKISLALTLTRLIPRSQPTHRASILVAYLSGIIGIGIVIQTCIFCAQVDKTWTHVSPYRCKVTAAAGSIRTSSEVVIDICLTLIPFSAFFWPLPFSIIRFGPHPGPNNPNNNPTPPVRLRLPPLTRRLIKFCFTANILAASCAIFTMILLFRTQKSKSREIQARIGYLAFVTSHLTGSVSLLVCNMLIVITSLYRFLRPTPRVAEIGKSPVVPNLRTEVNPGSPIPTGGVSNAASGTGERVRVTAAANASENVGSSANGGGGGSRGTDTSGHPTTRTHTSAGTSCHIEFTELYESDFSFTEPQRST